MTPRRPDLRPLRLVVLLCAALLFAGAPAGARDFEREVPAEPGGRLEVRLDQGDVEIEGHDQDSVRVEASSSGVSGQIEFELTVDDGDVRFEARRSGMFGWVPSGHLRVRVRVPDEFGVEVRTAGGKVAVEQLQGDVTVRTSGGDIQVSQIEGRLELHTSGGTIRVDEVEGDVEARTSGGDVRIREVEGRIDAETSGGSVAARDVLGPARVRTSGGSISLRFTEAPAGEAETSGGSVEVEFDAGSGFDLEASTSGGKVEIRRPIEVEGELGASEVRGRLNGGGPTLRLRASGGDIRVRER